MGIFQLANNLKGLDIRALALQIFDSGYIQDYIVELNTRKQLYKGLTSKGEPLYPKYASPDYAEDKRRMNTAPGLGSPDLYLFGDFYGGFTAELKGHIMEIYSRDEKADDLEYVYESDIYGLTPNNMDVILAEVLPELQELILQKLLN